MTKIIVKQIYLSTVNFTMNAGLLSCQGNMLPDIAFVLRLKVFLRNTCRTDECRPLLKSVCRYRYTCIYIYTKLGIGKIDFS